MRGAMGGKAELCYNDRNMQRQILRLLAALAGIAFPAIVHAAYSIDTGLIDPCITGDLACNGNLSDLYKDTILKAATQAFKGFLLGSLLYYGLRLLFTADSDNASTETKQAFVYAVTAAILVGGAEIIAGAFEIGTVDPSEVGGVFETTVLPFIMGLLSAALIANVTIQGILMIVSSDEGGATKARKRFIHGIIGVAIALLASPFVKAIMGKNSSPIVDEAVGIGDFLITIFGILAVVGVIVSGFMLILSVDESLKDKARKLLISCIVALIVVISSAALLHLFVFPSAS